MPSTEFTELSGAGGRPAAGRDLDHVTVDGERIAVRPGQTIAAVLLAAGQRSTRRTRVAGRPRGVFCGIGVCFDCLVVHNGESGVRACLQPAVPGDVIQTQDGVARGQVGYGDRPDGGSLA